MDLQFTAKDSKFNHVYFAEFFFVPEALRVDMRENRVLVARI